MRQLKITKSITNRESQSLEKYLQEIAKVDLLTPEEEVTLAIRIKEGDHQALEKLTKANLRFVVSVAKQYQNQGLGLSDLINEGNLGLMKAAQRFDETRGFKFISYAVRWIRQSILQALAEQGRVVRLPLNKVGLSYKIRKAYAQLEQEHEREPSAEELAELLDVSELEVETTMGVAAKHISIDSPVPGSSEEDFTMLDKLSDENAESPDKELLYDALKSDINQCLSILTENEKTVITHYFGIFDGNKWELEDIGEKIDLTRERVRQIKDKAIGKLRRVMIRFGYNSGNIVEKQQEKNNFIIQKVKVPVVKKEITEEGKSESGITARKKKHTPHPDIILSEQPEQLEQPIKKDAPVVIGSDLIITETNITENSQSVESPPLVKEEEGFMYHTSKANTMNFDEQIENAKGPTDPTNNNRFSSVLREMCGDITDAFLKIDNIPARLKKLDNLIDEEEKAIAQHLLVPEQWNSNIEASITCSSQLFTKVRDVAILLLDVLSDTPKIVLDPLIAKEYLDAIGYEDEETRKIAYHFFIEQDNHYSDYLKERGLYVYAIEAAQNLVKRVKDKTGKKIKFLPTTKFIQ